MEKGSCESATITCQDFLFVCLLLIFRSHGIPQRCQNKTKQSKHTYIRIINKHGHETEPSQLYFAWRYLPAWRRVKSNSIRWAAPCRRFRGFRRIGLKVVSTYNLAGWMDADDILYLWYTSSAQNWFDWLSVVHFFGTWWIDWSMCMDLVPVFNHSL